MPFRILSTNQFDQEILSNILVDYVSSVTEIACAFRCSLQKQTNKKNVMGHNANNKNYYQWSNKILENRCIISEGFLPHALCIRDI